MAFSIPEELLCLAIRIPNLEEEGSPRLSSYSTSTKGREEAVVWVELPLELCGEIGKRLSSRVDVVRFRSVCKKWRSSLPPPTRFPFLVPRPPGAHPRFKLFDSLPYFITESNIYSIEFGSKITPDKVVAEFTGLDQASKFVACSFLPDRPPPDLGFDLPTKSAATSSDPEHQLSRLTFIAKAYQLRLALPCITPFDERVEGKWDFLNVNFDVEKMVLVSSGSGNAADGIDANYVPLSNLSAVALLSNEPRLALLRLAGSQDPGWNWDTNFCSDVDIEDIVAYKGQLCMLASCGRVNLMDCDSLKMTEIAGPLPCETFVWHRGRLFADCGDLYLVVEASLQEIGVHRCVLVFKLDFQLRRWLKVDYTHNRVFLWYSYFSISIPRYLFTRMHGIWSRKDLKYCISSPACVIMSNDYLDKNGIYRGANGHCCVQLTAPYFRGFPWLLRPEDASTTTTTTTASSTILSQLDKTEVGRTNYLKLLRNR